MIVICDIIEQITVVHFKRMVIWSEYLNKVAMISIFFNFVIISVHAFECVQFIFFFNSNNNWMLLNLLFSGMK